MQVLDLSDNSAESEGTTRLAMVLRQNTLLRSLKLAENRIGDHAVGRLADAMKHNRALQALSLHDSAVRCGAVQCSTEQSGTSHNCSWRFPASPPLHATGAGPVLERHRRHRGGGAR